MSGTPPPLRHHGGSSAYTTPCSSLAADGAFRGVMVGTFTSTHTIPLSLVLLRSFPFRRLSSVQYPSCDRGYGQSAEERERERRKRREAPSHGTAHTDIHTASTLFITSRYRLERRLWTEHEPVGSAWREQQLQGKQQQQQQQQS